MATSEMLAGGALSFAFSEEQKMLREMVRRFVDQEVRPLAASIDQNKAVPRSLIDKAAELGLLGMAFPEEWGGAGVGKVGYCIMLEELARGCASTATMIGAHQGIGAMAIYLDGTEEQKRKYLIPLAEGRLIGAFALTEPNAGSDAAHIETNAVRDGNEYVLNGSKIWITNGDIADVLSVFAVTDKALGAHGGVTAFIVERDLPGFRVGKLDDKMGIRGTSTAEIIFENVRVPKENILGKVGEGFKTAMKTLDQGRLSLACGCLGGAKEALALSLQFAQTRVQFGVPISQHQAVQFMLAEMYADIFAMESMVYRVAWMADQGMPFSRESAIVKMMCSEALDRVVDKGVQVHGGMGYITEYPIERMYRDARINRIFEGTNEIQRLIIAGDILKRGFGWA
jgi:alkylation response protein AidB-like acyl-CoA dehydrogenase